MSVCRIAGLRGCHELVANVGGLGAGDSQLVLYSCFQTDDGVGQLHQWPRRRLFQILWSMIASMVFCVINMGLNLSVVSM